MLHLVFQSVLETALAERIDTGDDVVFLENSVLRTLANSSSCRLLTRLLATNRVCVLADQLDIRGINADELVEGVKVISYVELVELTTKHPVIQSWT